MSASVPSNSAPIFQDPAVLQAIQDQLGNLIGKSSGYESLPQEVKRRINALENLNEKHGAINVDFQKELIVLEKKYAKLHQPLYEKRAEIISGDYEPTDDEAHREKEDEEGDDEAQPSQKAQGGEASSENKKDETAPLNGIPEFWLTALKTHPETDQLIAGEHDDEALKHLVDIKSFHLDDSPGFRLEFVFSENRFFEDKVLTKTYYLQHSQDPSSGREFEYDRAEGCEIHWKEGQDLTVKIEVKKQRNKNTNKTRTVKRTVPTDTFFNFFKPPQAPENAEDEDEEDLEELGAKIEADYEVGDAIKDSVVPRAVDWFTGKALDYEEDDDHFGEEDFDTEDEDDEDVEDDDDDDESDAPAPKNGKGSKGRPHRH
ncbi:hypothetical protein SeMB42_g04044 [Synchytrium endobioticum]|uniref:Nucleosome assembly protein n=1 Tax=Synchytrium endobioticum TaxID=286115 RepID=A0A507D1K2_9FUNG|nr:hypothetical protein SeMB42_g04044 [Synchytrium endobioticum]